MTVDLPHDGTDPFVVEWRALSPDDEARREALTALGNGVFVVRGAPSWSAPDGVHYPATYRAGLTDRLPFEIGGEPAGVETIVNLPNAFALSFRIGDH